MRPRLVVLLCIATISGAVAAQVGEATAGKMRAASGGADRVAQTTETRAIWPRCPIPARFRSAYVNASRVSQLPLALLTALTTVESQFEPAAQSTAGATGLLQVMPATAKALELDVSTSEKNVIAGVRYLRMLLDQFGSTELALAAYDVGPDVVARANGVPSESVRAYVDEVQRLWRIYNGCR